MQLARVSLVLAVCLPSQAQFLQAIPKPSPNNCEERAGKMWEWLQDWANLARYRQADAETPPPPKVDARVVFMGDSITDSWKLTDYFPSKPFVNRGISGQTTPQMLVRFRQDVIELKPAVVVILAGTNDIAGNTGPMSLPDIERNLASMSDIAEANGIAVVLSSVLPVNNYTEASKRLFAERDPQKISELNRWLKNFANEHGHTYLDYFSAMVDEHGMLKLELSNDGLHPNAAGYKIMAPLAQRAIDDAIKSAPAAGK